MSGIDRQIFRLALPSIVSNITVPLLGLVDVAIVGHMGSAVYIGAISIGSMIFNILYWVFGFLRMGTSGMTSQALGRRDLTAVVQLLGRSLAVGLAVALAILVLQVPVKAVAFLILAPDPEILRLASLYFNICVWGAPAMLTLYALMGWYVGMQNTRFPMLISITQNIINIVVSLTLVYGLGMKVEGVALGTLIAQYAGVAIAIFLWIRHYVRLRRYFRWKGVFVYVKMLDFFKVNSDIFLRTLCLVAVSLYFLAAGSRQGAVVLAVNTLLTQLYILFSYVVDGFAFAGEAMSGRYLGAGNAMGLRQTVRRVFFWGTAIALLFTVVYALGGERFLALLTDEASVVKAAAAYFPWAVAVPLAGVAAFVWDGVFIGVTATRGMLLSSLVATLVFFAVYVVFKASLGNHALWMAFVVYLAVRGVVQTALWKRVKKARGAL
ncbi:MAG: MATE family efflux transporter [Prevotella sp.]|nr:MATE family efflux transporter [Prevotella sp.]